MSEELERDDEKAPETETSPDEETTAETEEESVDDAEAPEPDPIEELAKERDAFKDRWLRAVAEQDNLRKRTRRDVGEAHAYAKADVMRDLLDVLDDFDRAMEADDDGDTDPDVFREGIELIRNRLRESLTRKGLKRLEVAEGDVFDPRRHEAVAQAPGGDVESGAVLQVMQAGYVLDEQVLRPARVIVAQ